MKFRGLKGLLVSLILLPSILVVGGSRVFASTTSTPDTGSTGYGSSLISSSGDLYDWGQNNDGQIGDDTTNSTLSPVKVIGLSNVVQFSTGGYFRTALESNGDVYSWGNNSYGQLGDGSTTSSLTPVKVTGLSGVSQIASGMYASYALVSGKVYAWGYNNAGQLGDDSTTNSSTPVQVKGLSGVTEITAGQWDAYALSGGKVYSWGTEGCGELGNGSTTQSIVPVEVTGLSNILAIASSNRTCYALTSAGKIYSWGINSGGNLGNNSSALYSSTPVLVSNLSNVVQIATQGGGAYALESNGAVYSWGWNNYGQLGIGSTSNKSLPNQITGLPSNVIKIVGQGRGVYALTSDGKYYAWGGNSYGQLGDGTTNSASTPKVVSLSFTPNIDTGSSSSSSTVGNDKSTGITATISSGELSLEAPLFTTPFAGLTLDGTTQHIYATLSNWTVVDSTGTGNGWSIQAQASQFTEVAPSGGFVSGWTPLTLPTGSLTFVGSPSFEAQTGSGPVSTTGGPLFVGTNFVLDNNTPVTVAKANSGYGMGSYVVNEPTKNLLLTIEANLKLDSTNYPDAPTPFSSVVTFSVVSAP